MPQSAIQLHLEQLLTKLTHLPSGLALDIDDCLSHTSDGFYDLLTQTHPAPGYLTKELFRKQYALSGQVLHWKEIPDAYQLLKSKIEDADFHKQLLPIPNAPTCTKQLDRYNLVACYLTARPETMRTATQHWLNYHRFPNKPLIMRPSTLDFMNHHKEWKTTLLKQLHSKITGIIDNDTRILSHLQQQSYPGNLYLFGLSPAEYNGNGSITIRENWPEMADVILNRI